MRDERERSPQDEDDARPAKTVDASGFSDQGRRISSTSQNAAFAPDAPVLRSGPPPPALSQDRIDAGLGPNRRA